MMRILFLLLSLVVSSYSLTISSSCSTGSGLNVSRAEDFFGFFRTLTSFDLSGNEQVQAIVNETASAAGTLSYSYCTYSNGPDNAMRFVSLCSTTGTNCYAISSYEAKLCSSTSVCADGSFTVNCSGISDTFPDCALTCGEGIETCTQLVPIEPSPAPVAMPTSTSGVGMAIKGISMVVVGALAGLVL